MKSAMLILMSPVVLVGFAFEAIHHAFEAGRELWRITWSSQ